MWAKGSGQASADRLNRVLPAGKREVPFGRVRGFEVLARELTSDGGASYRYKCVAIVVDDTGPSVQQEVHEFGERAIRLLAAGRADWLHVGGDGGSKTASVLVSVCASATRHR